MKKIIISAVILAAIYGIYYYSKKAIAGTKLVILFSDLDLKNIQAPKIGLSIQNVTDTDINLESITGAIDVNGNTLANIQFNNPIVLSGKSIKKIYIDAMVSPANIPAVISFINSKNNIVKFIGNANAEGLSIPIDKQLNG